MRRRLFPWPPPKDRAVGIAVARERYERAVQTRLMTYELVEDLRAARERNHFRELFDVALRRT